MSGPSEEAEAAASAGSCLTFELWHTHTCALHGVFVSVAEVVFNIDAHKVGLECLDMDSHNVGLECLNMDAWDGESHVSESSGEDSTHV